MLKQNTDSLWQCSKGRSFNNWNILAVLNLQLQSGSESQSLSEAVIKRDVHVTASLNNCNQAFAIPVIKQSPGSLSRRSERAACAMECAAGGGGGNVSNSFPKTSLVSCFTMELIFFMKKFMKYLDAMIQLVSEYMFQR